MRMQVKVAKVDVSALQDRARQAKRAALFVASENALSDATPYVPMLTTALRTSGRAFVSAEDRGTVEWGGNAATSRYARRQHDHEFARYTTPGTGSDWTGRAKAERAQAWRDMFALEYGRRIHG